MVNFTSLQQSVLQDLASEQLPAVRLQQLVTKLYAEFACSAVVLLRLDGDSLRPQAAMGLPHEVLGRSFALDKHPRLAQIMAQHEPVQFAADSPLPDPYDGLLQENPEQPLPVHDCLGMSLYLDQQCWGAITLDALPPTAFSKHTIETLKNYAVLIESTLRVCRLETELRKLRLAWRDVAEDKEEATGLILGNSPAIHQLLDELSIVADSDLPVLLQGETGVGKELFARWLHSHSQRKDQPLIYVNCAALPENLAESELFGHVKGAFSGAASHRAGRFEAAHNGTLFLDEIGELPLSIQAKLLRALQNGEIQRLGEDKPHYVDVRIIAATNRRLADEVKNGSFRADLYHRLSVYPVHIPPLRERGDDILLLAGHFLELNRARLGLRCLRLTSTAEQALLHYNWPGNVRELEHVISRAALKVLSQAESRTAMLSIEAGWFGLEDVNIQPSETSQIVIEEGAQLPLKQALDQYQRQLIRQVLQQQNNNWAAAARVLDIDPSNLRKLAKRLQINP